MEKLIKNKLSKNKKDYQPYLHKESLTQRTNGQKVHRLFQKTYKILYIPDDKKYKIQQEVNIIQNNLQQNIKQQKQYIEFLQKSQNKYSQVEMNKKIRLRKWKFNSQGKRDERYKQSRKSQREKKRNIFDQKCEGEFRKLSQMVKGVFQFQNLRKKKRMDITSFLNLKKDDQKTLKQDEQKINQVESQQEQQQLEFKYYQDLLKPLNTEQKPTLKNIYRSEPTSPQRHANKTKQITFLTKILEDNLNKAHPTDKDGFVNKIKYICTQIKKKQQKMNNYFERIGRQYSNFDQRVFSKRKKLYFESLLKQNPNFNKKQKNKVLIDVKLQRKKIDQNKYIPDNFLRSLKHFYFKDKSNTIQYKSHQKILENHSKYHRQKQQSKENIKAQQIFQLNKKDYDGFIENKQNGTLNGLKYSGQMNRTKKYKKP